MKNQNALVVITDLKTTTVIRLYRIGMKDLPISITINNLQKAQNQHIITDDMLEQLPLALTTPIMVFRSATDLDSFVVMTGLKDAEDRTVIIPIRVNQSAGRILINHVTSIYGREKHAKSGKSEWFVKQVEDGRLVYLDKEKALKWSQSAGLQLPLEETIKNLKNRIHTDADIVKPEFSEAEDNRISFKKEKAFRAQVREETDNAVTYIMEHAPKNLPHLSFMERMLKNPLWYEHPIMKKIFNIMMRQRSEWYHERFNEFNDAKGEKTVSDEMNDLRKGNPRAYQQLQDLLVVAETEIVVVS